MKLKFPNRFGLRGFGAETIVGDNKMSSAMIAKSFRGGNFKAIFGTMATFLNLRSEENSQ